MAFPVVPIRMAQSGFKRAFPGSFLAAGYQDVTKVAGRHYACFVQSPTVKLGWTWVRDGFVPKPPPSCGAACRNLGREGVRPTNHLMILVVIVPAKAVKRILRWLLKAMG